MGLFRARVILVPNVMFLLLEFENYLIYVISDLYDTTIASPFLKDKAVLLLAFQKKKNLSPFIIYLNILSKKIYLNNS
jgi:hypothetical protein